MNSESLMYSNVFRVKDRVIKLFFFSCAYIEYRSAKSPNRSQFLIYVVIGLLTRDYWKNVYSSQENRQTPKNEEKCFQGSPIFHPADWLKSEYIILFKILKIKFTILYWFGLLPTKMNNTFLHIFLVAILMPHNWAIFNLSSGVSDKAWMPKILAASYKRS